AEGLAPPDGEVDLVQDAQPAIVVPVGEIEVDDLDQRRGLLGGEASAFGVHVCTRLTVRPRMRARPSVKRLRPMTRVASARPGPSTVIGAPKMSARFSLIMSPHSGVGGRMPKPRKPSEPISTGA